MSKIGNAFSSGKAFIGFVTAGDPCIEKTEEFILEMIRGGVDLIEIGIPFSDPTAEGEVIEAANARALSAGTNVDTVFALVSSLRQKTDIPLVFLTYLNPVLNYGYERFFTRCAEFAIDGIIVTDLPHEEKAEIRHFAEASHVDIISLIAPTSKERIRKIASDAAGFLYIVSSMGVTGIRSGINADLESICRAARQASSLPIAVGFGISTPGQAREIAAFADGVIVGSAIVKIIGEYGGKAAAPLYDYVKSMKEAISRDRPELTDKGRFFVD